jgi:GntR family galactonate operon transcriptional repressor
MKDPQPPAVIRPAPQLRSLKLGQRVATILVKRLTSAGDRAQAVPTEQEICAEFGVSKTVAREVIGQLVSMRLVAVRHGRRTQRRPSSQWDYLNPVLIDALAESDLLDLLSELHQVRLLLEPAVAALAAEKTDEARIERMRQLIESMRVSTDDPDAYLDLDVAFHGELVAAADNRILSQLVDSIGDLLRASRRVTNLLPHALLSATEAHGAVLDAVVAGDPEAARAAMTRHIEFAAAAWTAERARTRKAV